MSAAARPPEGGAPSLGEVVAQRPEGSPIAKVLEVRGLEVAYGGKEVGLGGVRPLVKRLCAKEPLPVVIQADEAASSGMVIRVIDEAKLGGAKLVNIATEKG